MFSYLIVALFAVLSLSVSSRPVQRSIDPCDEPTTSPTPTVAPSPTPTPTDDCYEPSSAPPAYSPSVTPHTSSPTTAPSSPTTTPTTSSPSSTPIPSSTSAPVSPTPAAASVNTSNGPFTGGVATYYYQDGNPGACGQTNSDSALICAMDQARFGTSGSSPLCGQQVQITNTNNGKTVTVTIADDCPTCENENSIDLSVAAFQALESDLSVGEFPISWLFL